LEPPPAKPSIRDLIQTPPQPIRNRPPEEEDEEEGGKGPARLPEGAIPKHPELASYIAKVMQHENKLKRKKFERSKEGRAYGPSSKDRMQDLEEEDEPGTVTAYPEHMDDRTTDSGEGPGSAEIADEKDEGPQVPEQLREVTEEPPSEELEEIGEATEFEDGPMVEEPEPLDPDPEDGPIEDGGSDRDVVRDDRSFRKRGEQIKDKPKKGFLVRIRRLLSR